MPLSKWETLITAQTAGAAITAASRTSAIPAQALFGLKPNFFDFIGKQLLIKAYGSITTDGAAPGTARWDVNFLDSAAANAIVFDGLAVLLDTAADHTNVGWELEILLTCRSLGSGTSATLAGQGKLSAVNLLGVPATPPKPGITALLPWNSATVVGAGFNSTLSQQVDLRFTQTVAGGTPANSMTLQQYSLIALN